MEEGGPMGTRGELANSTMACTGLQLKVLPGKAADHSLCNWNSIALPQLFPEQSVTVFFHFPLKC